MRAKTQSVTNRLPGYEVQAVPQTRSAHRSVSGIAGAKNASSSQMVVAANSGDHPLLLKFLTQLQVVRQSEFQQTADCPSYEPSQRLIIRNRGEIIGHIRIVPRELRFGVSTISSYHLTELCVLPEFRQAGAMRLLLAAVRQRAASNRIALITSDSNRPEILRRMGWARIPTGTNVTTSPHSLLASLEEMNEAGGETQWKDRYEVRPLRFVDQPAMAELYSETASRHFGMAERSQEDWLWLMGRRGFDRAFVAFEPFTESILGYCLLRANQVVELVADAQHPLAMLPLLRRSAADVLERGVHSIAILADSAPDLELEGFRSVDIGVSIAACVPSPYDFMKLMKAELGAQALRRGATPESTIGLVSGTEALSLEVTKSKLRLKRNAQVRSRIQVSPSMMTKLALGSVEVNANHDAEELSATTKTASDVASRIFAKRRFLQMPLENLPTLE